MSGRAFILWYNIKGSLWLWSSSAFSCGLVSTALWCAPGCIFCMLWFWYSGIWRDVWCVPPSTVDTCFLLHGHAVSSKSSVAVFWHSCHMNFGDIALYVIWSHAKNCCMVYRDEPTKNKFYDALVSNLLLGIYMHAHTRIYAPPK